MSNSFSFFDWKKVWSRESEVEAGPAYDQKSSFIEPRIRGSKFSEPWLKILRQLDQCRRSWLIRLRF